MKLNLGCGKKTEKGYINADIVNLKGVDKVFDFNKYPFPFKDNTFEEIKITNAIHCVENLILFMNEISRVCKNGAIIKIKSQFFLSPESACDPLTKTNIGYNSFNLFLKNPEEKMGASYDSKAKFKILKRKWIFSENKYLKWLNFIPNLSPRFYSRFLYFYFPSNKLYFELQVIK